MKGLVGVVLVLTLGGLRTGRAEEGMVESPAASTDESAVPPAAAVAAAPGIEILFHADVDGRLKVPDCDGDGAVGGDGGDYATLVGKLASARADAASEQHPAPVALLGGNATMPDLFGASLLTDGPQGMESLAGLFARAGYDAVGLGHNELSLGPDVLPALLAALTRQGLPVVASNLRCDAARRATCRDLREDVLIERGGVRIGVLATMSPAVWAGLPVTAAHGLSLADPVQTVRAGVRRLHGRGATVVVLLADGPRDARALDDADDLAHHLAEAPPAERPDVVLASGLADLDGHHPVRLLRRDDAPPVFGSSGGVAGFSRVTLSPGQPPVFAVSALPAAGATADAETAKLLSAASTRFCALYGTAAAPAPLARSVDRDTFVDYVLQVMRRRAGAEIAVINRPFVKRAAFPLRGRFTRADLYRALPYRAQIGVASLSGAVLDAAFAKAWGKPRLAVVGLARDGGATKVNGRPIDKARRYRVATITFVADGGDDLFEPDTLPFKPLRGSVDVRDAVEDFLAHDTAAEDGDPGVDPNTDFGTPAGERALIVGLGDLGLDLTSTSIVNGAGYGDAQLARARQLALGGDATGLFQLRSKVHEADGRLQLKYGWARTQPPGAATPTEAETTDLITFTTTYNFRGLRGAGGAPRAFVPDPYARVWVESEFTRPAVSPTQPRTYRHLQLTNTAGALFTLMPKLKVRGGAGAQRELLASGSDGAWRLVLEAGAVLDPVAIATFGPLAVKLEGLADYDFIDPGGLSAHQVRAGAKVSVPMLPALFVTAGVNVYAVKRHGDAWASSTDATVGLKLHWDGARQSL